MSRITRRDFVASAAASSAAYALGAGLARAASRLPSSSVDVAIIGAGAAGIRAGIEVQKAGRSYVILEARRHIGGRTVTDSTSFPGIPWDLGAQWFHFVTPQLDHPGRTHNPLFDIARRLHKRAFPDTGTRLLLSPPAAPVDLLDSPAFSVLGDMALDIVSAGVAAGLGLSRDVSVTAATVDLAHEPDYKLVLGLIQAALGGSTDHLSNLDLFNESEGGALLPPIVPSLDNWLIPSGLGALVVSQARGLTIRTNTAVNRIDWSGTQGVALDTSAGRLAAKTVVVTVPIGPLAAGRPAFTPDLPARYADAIHRQLNMGHTAKIGLRFADGFALDVPENDTFVSPNQDTTAVPLVQARAFGHKNFAILIASGTDILDLERKGQLVEYSREQIRGMFGSKAANALRKGVATTWNTSRFSLGSFSHARPGGVPGRHTLAKPLAKRIFFAGEAVSIVQHSSAPGAWTTGQQAAAKALRAIGGGPPGPPFTG